VRARSVEAALWRDRTVARTARRPPRDDAPICYTSGTGRPEGCGASPSQLHHRARFPERRRGQWSVGSHLVTTPIAHRTGLPRIVNMVCHGSAVVIMPRFEGGGARLIETSHHGAGMVPDAVGRMLIEAVEKDPARFASLPPCSALRGFFPPSLAERFELALPRCASLRISRHDRVGQVAGLTRKTSAHLGSVGRRWPGIEIKLSTRVKWRWRRRNGSWSQWAPRPVLVMREYYNFRKLPKRPQRRWLATGDLGRARC